MPATKIATVARALTLDNLDADFDLNVDGSITPQSFSAGPTAGSNEVWEIIRLRLVVSDSNIAWNAFGGIMGGLDEGIIIQFTRDGVSTSLIEGALALSTNNELACFSSDFKLITFAGNVNTMLIDWDLPSLQVGPLTVDERSTLDVVVQDDLTGLSAFEVVVFVTKRSTVRQGE